MTISNIEKWGVIYIWEQIINTRLIDHYLRFDKVIFIQKITDLVYMAYITVKPIENSAWASKVLYTKVDVTFNSIGKCIGTRCTLLYYIYRNEIENISNLIFDKRHEFDLLLS